MARALTVWKGLGSRRAVYFDLPFRRRLAKPWFRSEYVLPGLALATLEKGESWRSSSAC